ncbi:MAG: hypothetical protein IKQ99_00510 [Alphaproteobacteria bacterium]|nr:hypothetical protein [Alphaproteobacteria bacterium]
MRNKYKHTLSGILIAMCFMCIGVWTGRILSVHNFRRPSIFSLQEKYEKKLENKLVDLLEPTIGIGNIQAAVQAEIKRQKIIKKQFDPQNKTQTVIRENDPVLVGQSISVLINGASKNKLSAYERLIKTAVGFNQERGDKLTVEILPFAPVSFWSFGLSPMWLIRTGGVLFLCILAGIIWLCFEWINIFSQKKNCLTYPASNNDLWQQIENIPTNELANLLKSNRPEITAFVLYRLPQEKSAGIVDLLPTDYMNQVTLHLNHIEKLPPADKSILLQETEEHLVKIVKAFQWNNKTSDFTFNKLKNWNDKEIQALLHYVSKNDLVNALQIAPKEILEKFQKNIPSDLWETLVQKIQLNSCSKEESEQAQKKILHTAELLKEKT